MVVIGAGNRPLTTRICASLGLRIKFQTHQAILGPRLGPGFES